MNATPTRRLLVYREHGRISAILSIPLPVSASPTHNMVKKVIRRDERGRVVEILEIRTTELAERLACEQIAAALYDQARIDTSDASAKSTLVIDASKLPRDLNPAEIADALARLAHERAPGRVAEVRLEHPSPAPVPRRSMGFRTEQPS
jgi:hypothetical protein